MDLPWSDTEMRVRTRIRLQKSEDLNGDQNETYNTRSQSSCTNSEFDRVVHETCTTTRWTEDSSQNKSLQLAATF